MLSPIRRTLGKGSVVAMFTKSKNKKTKSCREIIMQLSSVTLLSPFKRGARG
jgi:hypothetical protein